MRQRHAPNRCRRNCNDLHRPRRTTTSAHAADEGPRPARAQRTKGHDQRARSGRATKQCVETNTPVLVLQVGQQYTHSAQAHTVGKHIQWSSTYSGQTHTVIKHIQWSNTYSGQTHTVIKHIQWSNTYSGQAHTVVKHIQWSSTYNGQAHTMVKHIQWSNTYSGQAHTVVKHIQCSSTYSAQSGQSFLSARVAAVPSRCLSRCLNGRALHQRHHSYILLGVPAELCISTTIHTYYWGCRQSSASAPPFIHTIGGAGRALHQRHNSYILLGVPAELCISATIHTYYWGCRQSSASAPPIHACVRARARTRSVPETQGWPLSPQRTRDTRSVPVAAGGGFSLSPQRTRDTRSVPETRYTRRRQGPRPAPRCLPRRRRCAGGGRRGGAQRRAGRPARRRRTSCHGIVETSESEE
jgi:hypothetical protein